MKLVIDALSELKDQLEFGLIVNKLSKKGVSFFNDNLDGYQKKMARFFPSIKFNFFGYELNQDAMDEENFLIPLNQNLKSFVWSIKPVIIYSEEVKDIKDDEWSIVMDMMAKLSKEVEDVKVLIQKK